LSFPKENVVSLFNEECTKENILRAYLRLARGDVELDDRVFIFFAGHGHTMTGSRGEVGFLAPYDAEMSDTSTFVRWDELTRNSELIRAKHMLFVMDACYSGLALTRSAQAGSSRFLKDMLLRHSRQVIAAGKANETVADSGGPLPNHSVFTGHLIEALKGKATSDQGVLTATGLMSYVYDKVSSDKNSNQTPHFGHFEGDGDFIFKAPTLTEDENSENIDVDRLLLVPFVSENSSLENSTSKISKVKNLIATESLYIELHDYMVSEVRRFLSNTGQDNFQLTGTFSQSELLDRIERYECHASDLAGLTACLAYWAKPNHAALLQKIIARSSDRLEATGGIVPWLTLRWYPLIILLYSAGIAATEGSRHDSLANLFYARVSSSQQQAKTQLFAEAISEAIHELNQTTVFKQLPGHERHYTPISEYLFKTLQPALDDLLFIGKSYEDSFDEFEVMFALVVVDIGKQQDNAAWGPIGRFGWKRTRGVNAPLDRLIARANSMREKWEPLHAGLFGGSFERFITASDELTRRMSSLHWY
jgi:hypothetical protein